MAKSCPTFANLIVCSLPGSSVHGICQARILEWVDISFSRGSSQPRDRTHISCIAGGFFTAEPPGKPRQLIKNLLYSIGNSTQYSVMAYVGKESNQEWIYVYV